MLLYQPTKQNVHVSHTGLFSYITMTLSNATTIQIDNPSYIPLIGKDGDDVIDNMGLKPDASEIQSHAFINPH